jgi:pre-mRNA-splicing factor 38
MDTKPGRQASYQDKRNVVNKAYLLEPIIRHRIQESVFYKQYLYLTNEATILPVIINHVKYIGGTDSFGKPSEFLCCVLRLLELDPSVDIIDVYRDQLGYNEFKYLTAVVLLYIRLCATSAEVYNKLDKYYQDYRKLRFKLKSPEFDSHQMAINYKLTYIDEWVDELLLKDRVVDIKLPRLVPRQQLLEKQLVQPRQFNVDVDEESSGSGSDYESDSD